MSMTLKQESALNSVLKNIDIPDGYYFSQVIDGKQNGVDGHKI